MCASSTFSSSATLRIAKNFSALDNSEFGERSEEGEKGNQKRHQKVQKEESQLPLSGSLPLSGTQKVTGGPLRGRTELTHLPLSGMTSSSGKRLKPMATKRKEKEPEQPHSSRFLSRKHEKHFKVVQDRRLLMERKVGMIPNFAPQFGEQLLGNDWGKLATYPALANIAVVKEFYTNAKKIGDYPTENYLSYVKGHAIRYDLDSINNFLDTVWAGEQCQFALCNEEGANFEDVERVLCIPGGDGRPSKTYIGPLTRAMAKRVQEEEGSLNILLLWKATGFLWNLAPSGGHFQRNRSGSVVNIRRVDLTPLAKALFIYCAIRNLNVNIGQVIADEISEFGERSEEGEKGNQKRHQKVQKEESQLPLSGSLPLSGTQKVTGGPLRGRTELTHLPLSSTLPLSGTLMGLGLIFL
ncbi:hypothetical protein LR48_Vigan03g113800 [Vigna angularis]|uniref:Putative plant transposon protein domain-containing protein n=1 Tax=Phaseolus angularis TaxID=3914 RepID=A0A0L9U4Q2_PHAAN|nr:hypothetical protein LR48_Vigan03g113800 [Vigna angularis]